jgi:peroxiredoxin
MVQQAQASQEQEEQQAKLDQLIPVGSVAPDFTQTTPEGTKLSLSDLRGKVVLIDFWASWCRPCRMEMPNVKKAYAIYHPKGLEVLGVSLDKTKDAWTGAIKQDGLTWKHVSDLAFWNNAAAQLYGVSSIPYSVLVDRDGKVIAKNLRGPALEAKLAEVFK